MEGPDFPYTAEIGGRTVATTGPMDQGDHRLIFGLNTQRMSALSPFENFELMSYCTPTWISDVTYNALQTAINNFSPINPFRDPSALPGTTQEFMIFNGIVDLQNDTVDFGPFGIISSPVAPPALPIGDYTLQLLDSSGSLLDEILVPAHRIPSI